MSTRAALEDFISELIRADEEEEVTHITDDASRPLRRSGPPIIFAIRSRRQVAMTPPVQRVRYRVPENDKCLRLVEAHNQKLTDEADTTCMICCEKKVNVELIHSEKKSGKGEEHKCHNNRYCIDCISKSIAAQETHGAHIIPQCPCCKGRVAKMVKLDSKNAVLDLPPFKPQPPEAVVKNAMESKLVFAFNSEKKDNKTIINSWDILAPTFDESDVDKWKKFKQHANRWPIIWNHAILSGAPFNTTMIGWPQCRELIRSINIKLNAIDRQDLRWLPRVYGGSMHVPTGAKKKRKRSSKSRKASGASSSKKSKKTTTSE